MVLIGLLSDHFWVNLNTKMFPSHFISVSKQDILDIKGLSVPSFTNRVKLTGSLIDFSGLERLSKLV
jgi:hypothetical protein